jgi:hypothetical protein
MTTPENRVKQKVKKLLDAHKPDVWYFCPATGGYGKSGVPDFFLSVHGRVVTVETKASETDHPTKLQGLCMDAIVRSGGHTVVVRGLSNEDPGWCRLEQIIKHRDFRV